MPLYAYRCTQCGHAFEELVPMSRREEAACPECGGAAQRAKEGVSAFAVGVSRPKPACSADCPGGCGCPGKCGCGH